MSSALTKVARGPLRSAVSIMCWLLALSGSLSAHAQSVSKGADLYKEVGVGGKGCAAENCHGANVDKRKIGNASNIPSKITEAINRKVDPADPDSPPAISGMQNLGLSEEDKLSLALYIGQKKKPLLANGSFSVKPGGERVFDAYPLLASNGDGGAAMDNGFSATDGTRGTTREQIDPKSDKIEYNITYKTNRADYTGPDTFTYTVVNPAGTTTATISVNIANEDPPEVSIDPSSLTGTCGQSFRATISATNPPITEYGATGLPKQLVVNASTGEISGIPEVVGSFPIRLTARNDVDLGEDKGDFAITITCAPPIANSASITVSLNTPTTVDLAQYITGFKVSGVSLIKLPTHGSLSVNGTKVTYIPRNNYFGPDSFAFVGIGLGGTSEPTTATLTVVGRPDPAKDREVTGLIGAEIEAAQRFSRAQILNVRGRLESLHHPSTHARETNAKQELTTIPIATEDRVVLTQSSNLNLQAHAAGGNSLTLLAGQLAESMFPELAANAFPRGVLGALLTASQSRTLDLSDLASTDGPSAPGSTGLWAAGNIGFGDRDASRNRSGFKFKTSGISIGADHRFSNKLVLGVGLGYARDRTSIGNGGTQSRARATSLSLYGSFQPPSESVFVDGLVGYGVLDYDTERFVDALTEVNLPQGVEPTKHYARASRDGSQIFGSIAAGYESPRESGFLWSPYARLDFSRHQLDRATETGAGQYALTYFKQNLTHADLSLGIRAQWEHELRRGGVALPQIRLEYTRNLKSDGRASLAYADLIDGPRYSVPAVGDDRDALTLGVGSDFVLCSGVNLGIDYQFRHSSGAENSQGLQFRLAKELGVAKRSCEPSDGGSPPNRRVTADAAFTYDDNVTRARDDAGKLADKSFSVKATKELEPIKLGHFSVVVSGTLGGEAFRRFSDLGHVFGEVQGELRYPAYGPKVALFARGAVDHYKSQIRRGQTYSAGVVLQRNFTQRGIGLTAQLAYNQRYGESGVFDLKDTSAQVGISYPLNKDLSTGKTDVLYLAGEYRLGDVVSTEKESLANLNIADVFVRDDAFDRNDLFSYRFNARTTAATIGYIKPLASGHLDLSWTYTQSSPTESSFPGAGSERYIDNQFKLVYVLHFGTWNRMSRFRAY